MKLPKYVPDAVRQHAESYLNQYESLLAQYKAEAAELIQKTGSAKDPEQQDKLRKKLEEKSKSISNLSQDTTKISGLIQDFQMKDVYRILADEFGDDPDQKSVRFIHSAWAAWIDYQKYRDRIRTASELSPEIAKAAKELAALLDQVVQDEPGCPTEFYSISELLRSTNNPADPVMWAVMRPKLLGDDSREANQSNQPTPSTDDPPQTIQLGKLDQDALRYAWTISPKIPCLLKQLAISAEEYTPVEGDYIGTGISGRKQCTKTEYLRGFASLLREHKIEITPNIKRAITTTTNVILLGINDGGVSSDDVRKVLSSLR